MPEMGVNSLKANLQDLARSNLFEVIIPSPPGGGDYNALLLRCMSSSVPGRSVGEIKVPFKQTSGLKFHGKLTFSQIWKCTFIEGEDRKIFDAIHAWNQKVVDTAQGTSTPDSSLKTDVYLTLITVAGQVYQKIRLVGCYPQEVGDVTLEQGSEEPVRYDVTLSYDYWDYVS